MGLFSCLQQQQRWKPSSDNIVVVVLPFLFSFSWIQKNTFLFNEQEIPLGNFPGEGLQIKQAVLSIVKLFWEILIACLLYIFCLLLKYLLRRFDQKRQNVRFEAENKSADVKDHHSFRRLKENEKFLLSILSGWFFELWRWCWLLCLLYYFQTFKPRHVRPDQACPGGDENILAHPLHLDEFPPVGRESGSKLTFCLEPAWKKMKRFRVFLVTERRNVAYTFLTWGKRPIVRISVPFCYSADVLSSRSAGFVSN